MNNNLTKLSRVLRSMQHIDGRVMPPLIKTNCSYVLFYTLTVTLMSETGKLRFGGSISPTNFQLISGILSRYTFQKFDLFDDEIEFWVDLDCPIKMIQLIKRIRCLTESTKLYRKRERELARSQREKLAREQSDLV